ncbi:unnamed protein product, partial [Rotaria magnacalcarata]
QGAIPFAGDTISGDTYKKTSNDRRLERPKQCQENLWAVISDSLLNEPESRYEFSAIKKRLSDLQDISHGTCNRCGRKFPFNELTDHQRECRPQIPRRIYTPPRLMRCTYCTNKFSQGQIHDHEKSCPKKPRSCIGNILSCLSFFRSKNK